MGGIRDSNRQIFEFQKISEIFGYVEFIFARENFLPDSNWRLILHQNIIHTSGGCRKLCAASVQANCHEKFRVEIPKLKAGGKPSTWLPPGGLVERFEKKLHRKAKSKFQKFPKFSAHCRGGSNWSLTR